MTRADDASSPHGPVEAGILAELAPSFRVERANASGASLRYLVGGEGPAIVLLHGRGGASTAWFQLLPALAARGRVIAIDLPGFGRSRAAFARGGFEQALRYFVDPIEALLVDLDARDAAVAGHSLGGFVALELALGARIQPRKLALIGSMGLGAEMSRRARLYFRLGPERLARALGPRLFRRLHAATDTPLGRRLDALAFELSSVAGGRDDASRAFDALCPLFGPLRSRARRLADVAPPTLVVHGLADEVFPASLAVRASRRIPNASLLLDAVGHAPHHEAPAIGAAILDYLTSAGT